MHRRAQPLQPKIQALSPSEFEGMVRLHEAYLAGRPGAVRALPRYVVAHRMRCDGRLLIEADFTGADLTGSIFIGGDLSRAAFYCATLAKCDFRNARLVRADLRGASFAGAKLEGAVLDEADLRAAVLCVVDETGGLRRLGAGAKVAGASLDGARLDEVVGHAVDFSNCSLRGAKLRNANLKNADFSDANLTGADLVGAKLAGATLTGAILCGVEVTRLGLSAQALAGCVVDPSPAALARLDEIREELDQAELWAKTDGAKGRPARLDGADLRPAQGFFRERVLAGFTAKNLMAIGVDFSLAQLQGANFDGADLRGADFTGADLRGASFKGAKLSHARFVNADLGALPLSGGASRPISFDGASLEGTGLIRRTPAPARQEI